MNYDEYYKKYLASSAAQKEKDKQAQEAIFKSQEDQVNAQYGSAITGTKKDYDELYRQNEVSRIIQEKQIAETMANMGLTDSGLNRTQQTANVLSHANNRGSIDRQKQKVIDDYTLKLTDAIASIKQNRTATMANIDSSYDSAASSYAQDMVKADIEAETARQKAWASASSGGNSSGTDYSDIEKKMLSNSYSAEQKEAVLLTWVKQYGVDISEPSQKELVDRLLDYAEISSKSTRDEFFRNINRDKYKNFTTEDWTALFKDIVNNEGKAEALKELQYYQQNGMLPSFMISKVATAIGI